MSTIRATYVQHGSSTVPNITLNASGQVIVASGIVSSGTFAAPSGSASAPGVYFDGDTNTGLYSPGADQLAISTGGFGRLFVTSGGSVGINTSSVVSVGTNIVPLEIKGNATNRSGALVLSTSDNSQQAWHYFAADLYFTGTSTNHDILFLRNGTERMRLTSTGLGIGDSAPDSTVTIKAAASTTPLKVSGPSSEFLRCDSSGRLLVGTSSTSYGAFLTVQGFSADPTGAGIIQIKRGSNATTANQPIGLVSFGDGLGNERAIISAEADAAGGSGDLPTRLVFSTTPDSGSSPVERVRIGSNGNVGIGSINSSTIRLYVLGANTANTDYTVYTENSANTNTFHVRNDGVFCTGVAASSPYNNTTASAANVFITSGGVLQRSTSSIKYKTDVRDAVHGLSELLSLRPVTYKGKAETDQGKIFGGLIAEEVHDAGLSEFVQYAEDGSPDALAYGNMVSLCIKAIQEQQAMIVELQAKVAALESA